MAGDWAVERGVECLQYPADWEKLGRAAGPIRNEQMLREGKPDLVVAFPGARGTAHMVRIAREAGVRVIEIAADAGRLTDRSKETPELDPQLKRKLATWARTKPDVIALYVFGSRAAGTARPDSDLDLVFEIDDRHETQDTVLIANSPRWRRELEKLTGLHVGPLYPSNDSNVTWGAVAEVYRQPRASNDRRP